MGFTVTQYIVAWGTVIAVLALIIMAIYDLVGAVQRLFGRVDNSQNDVLVQQMFAENVNINRDPTAPTAQYGAVNEALERRKYR